MKGVKQTTTEIITIEEAIYDYKQAYEDYQETITKANKFLENDKDVIKAILNTYFPASEVDVKGTEITLTYGYDRPFLTKNFKPNIVRFVFANLPENCDFASADYFSEDNSVRFGSGAIDAYKYFSEDCPNKELSEYILKNHMNFGISW